MKKKFKILIDPFSNLHYSAFYILGLLELYPNNIEYIHEPFKNLKSGRRTCFLFILREEDSDTNVAIDFHDPNKIELDILLWSSIYAKINYNHKDTIEDIKKKIKDQSNFNFNVLKIVSIPPPSFGVKIFDFLKTSSFVSKIIFMNNISLANKKNIILGVVRMYVKRLPISYYKHSKAKRNYIFHISSIWAKDTDFINFSRRNFIRASKSIEDVDFEGGLVEIGYKYEYLGNIKDIIYSGGKIPLKEYIDKTRKSFLVFNGPSVEKCHGWKLAEYLSMGKAIISTPLYNDLPTPLVHGENIHFVEDNYDSIKMGIEYLINNPDYVRKLEVNALKYWNDNVEPKVVVKNILNRISEI